MRLTVRREQMDVMQAVSDANFERRIASHLRGSYSDSIVKLPDGAEFSVTDLREDMLARLVRSGILKARRYEMKVQSSIAAFVALMFEVAPNFDEHRLCEVLLGDEEKTPDDRVDDILSVLTEKNWDAIRKDYDPEAWLSAEQEISPDATAERPAGEKAKAATADPISRTSPGKTLSGKTLSGKTLPGKTLSGGKTMSRTMSRKSPIKLQPEVSDADTEFDQNTVKSDRKE